MPTFSPRDLLQVLILAAGVYLVLSFLRTAQGSGVVKRLGAVLLILGMFLYGVTNALELREVQQVLDAIMGVGVIVLAILFQPELRRGILSLGDHKLLGRFLSKHAPEAIDQVCEAAIEMSKKRQGALIAFERKTPLDSIMTSHGVRIDAPVSAELLDSIFFPSAALHDGAVVILDNRIVAAAVLFPLTENTELSKSTGTRHRAALGLTEQSDGIAVIVSEETGSISICSDGKMERRIARERFREVLGERLGLAGDSTPETSGVGELLRGIFTKYIGQKVAAAGMGLALFLVASNQVTESREFEVRLQPLAAQDLNGPVLGQLAVIAPPAEDQSILKVIPVGTKRIFKVRVIGPREEMQQLEDGIGGNLTLDPGVRGELTLDASSVRWGIGRVAEELEVSWVGEGENAIPRVDVRQFNEHLINAQDQHVKLKTRDLDSRYDIESVTLRPTEARVLSPAGAGDLQEQLAFEDVYPIRTNDGLWSMKLTLAADLREQGFELLEDILVEAHIVPRMEDLGTIDRDIVLVSLDPEQTGFERRYAAPTAKARLRIRATSMLPPGSSLEQGDVNVALRQAVTKLARVYVDVSQISKDGTRTAPIEINSISNEKWMAELDPDLASQLDLSPSSLLLFELEMDEATLVLEPLESSESGSGADPVSRKNP